MLKALTWLYVIFNPALATQQFAQRRMIRELFQVFVDAATSRNEDRFNIFPFAFRTEVREAGGDRNMVIRLVVDLLAGMADRRSVRISARLYLTGLC